MTNIVGPGKEVSEKSLELNVCAEMLQHIRAWPGCERALWLGLTQRQERRAGLDELIRNVGSGFALMLQFKAPWPSSDVDDLYKFSINERQHEALEQLADKCPEAVYYVFPLYSQWTKADRHAPDLTQDTWLVPLSSMPLTLLTSLSTPASGRHRVELERNNSGITVTAYSPRVIGEAINAKEYFEERSEGQSLEGRSSGVSSDHLREWVDLWDNRPPLGESKAALGDERSIALRFRGLNGLYVPQGEAS